MKAIAETRLIKTIIIVEKSDVIKLAQGSGLWPHRGEAQYNECWYEESDGTYRITVYAPDTKIEG